MQVKINGKIEPISDTNLLGLLRSKNIEPQMVSVELNGTLLTRASLADTPVKEGDQIEFLYFMGGGCHGHRRASALVGVLKIQASVRSSNL